MRYDGTAYDYNRINGSAVPKELPQRNAQIKVMPHRKRKAKGAQSLFLKIAAAGVVLFMLSFNIYTRAEINDVQTEIDKAKSTI